MTSKPPVNRSRRLTKALKEEIYDRISEGETLQQACAEPHMPDLGTVYGALRADEVFRRDYRIAKQCQLEAIADLVLGNADGVTSDNVEEATRRFEELERLYDEQEAETYGPEPAPAGGHHGP